MDTPREHVEQFHLLFLDQLSRNFDSKLYAVKGDCNLRFFFKSIRYSEDLDIDVHIISVDTLKNKINRILNGTPFQSILRTRGIAIDKISLPKQTETTQRWKMILQTHSSLPINTKIEFSRRGMNKQTHYESIDPEIIQHHRLTPIFCTHYDSKIAFQQKIEALAGRPQTQARDIFDLFLLIKTAGAIPSPNTINTDLLDQAQNNALSITFSDFKSQVVAFLPADYQRQYDTSTLWENILSDVVDQLESLKS